MSTPPNVVIIMVDEQKANSLPLYGNPVVRTPNLARLAEEGVLFDQAYATCPLCVPARVSLMTGRYPHTTGSRTNAFLLQPGERHLLEVFREHGYRTGLSGKNHCFLPDDLARFDYLWEAGHAGPRVPPNDEAAAAQRWIRESGVGARAWGAARNPYPPEALGTALITDHAIEFVDRYRDEPFFLWYSIADPHTPLQTSSPYAEMYRPEDVPLPPRLEGEIEAKPPAQQIDYRALAGDTVTEAIMRRAIATYYGMNTYIDDQVGRFLDRLAELGLRENTILVYLSDHGDYMGEHRMVRKSKALYDCLCRIPLIVSWPGGIAPGAPRDPFVCIEDILPSLLDLLGWPAACCAGVQGKSFAPLLRGGAYDAREAIYGEAGLEGRPYTLDECTVFPEGPLTPDFTPRNKKGGRGRIKSVRTRRWKLVHYPGQSYGELYDLEADPWELCNLYGQSGYQDIAAALRTLLLDWAIEGEETLPVPPPGKDIVDG